IIDLNNVPLVSGTSYVKWDLSSSRSAEHRGRTLKSIIKEHKVCWDYEKTLPVRLTVDRNGMLQESEIHFEVLQEYSSGARGERIVLGNVKLNLAEYVEGSDGDGEEGISRRYLMQESKINSTLKIAIQMKQLEGDRNFIAPPLKTAPVFGGIAGIMASEQGEPDDLGHLPSMSSKSRELGELQDMYRRALTASWAAQAGELPADECIEDIFAGGDGWSKKKTHNMPAARPKPEDDGSGSVSDSETIKLHQHKRSPSGFGRHVLNKSGSHGRSVNKGDRGTDDMASGQGRGRTEPQRQQNKVEKQQSDGHMHEVDELDIREDLRSWQISYTP
ncbi:MAG: hypothetical protein M1830_004968, partial [Pleopsidium flavum]